MPTDIAPNTDPGTQTPAQTQAGDGAASAAGEPERKFTQAEVDELMAKIRRDERRKAQESAKGQSTLLERLDKVENMLKTESLAEMLAKAVQQIQGQAQGQGQSAQPQAAQGQAGQGQGQSAQGQGQPTGGSAQAPGTGAEQQVPPSVMQILAETKARSERLERELAEQKRSANEARQAQERMVQAQARADAEKAVAAALIEATPGMSKTAAEAMARLKIADGEILFDGGRVRWIVKNPDAEYEEDRVKEVPLKTGAQTWSKSREALDLVPPPVRGPGSTRTDRGNSNSQANDGVNDWKTAYTQQAEMIKNRT